MSKKLIEMDNGLMMQVDIPQQEIEMISGGGDVVEKVGQSMSAVEKLLIQSVQPIIQAYQILNKEMTLKEAEVEIGIGFSAEGNIFVAKGTGSANLTVKLVLSPKPN